MVLNIVALYVFCFRTKQKTTSIIYTINLAVTDLLVNLSLPTRILLYYSGGSCLTCSYLHTFSYFVNMYCSILFLTCICVDRYLAIVQVGFSIFVKRSQDLTQCGFMKSELSINSMVDYLLVLASNPELTKSFYFWSV